MKNFFAVTVLFMLAVLFVFMGCENTPGEETDYVVKTEVTPAGSGRITATPAKGPAGTEVAILVEPIGDYKYTAGSFKVTGKSSVSFTGTYPNFTFELNEDVTVSAAFEALAANEYRVNIASGITYGTVSADVDSATTGDTVTLTVTPDRMYQLKAGSLKYLEDGGTTSIPISGTSFTMPASAVTVSAEFEKGDANSLLAEGERYLEEGNLDAAINAFEDSYGLNNEDPDAVIYSTLAKLASIAVNDDVKALMKDRLGVRNYPGTIGSLISPDWMANYTGTEEFDSDFYDSESEEYWNWRDEDDDEWFFQEYEITPARTGYYVYSSDEGVSLVPYVPKDTDKFDDYERILITDRLWGYRNEGGKDVYWHEDIPYYLGGQDPGYYWLDESAGKYVFETAAIKYADEPEAADSFTDPDSGYWYSWLEDSYADYEGFDGEGYYRYKQTYEFMGDERLRYHSSSSRLPGLDVPSWFENSETYNNSKSLTGAPTGGTFSILLFANLLDKNTSGLNNLLSDLLSANIFGADGFEAAYNRFQGLTDEDKVTLSAETIAAFGLTEFIEGDEIWIGKAELRLLFSALRFVKAGLEWVATYDWDTDLNFLAKTGVWSEDGMEVVTCPASLPLRNGFLKVKDSAKMDASKGDFIRAIDDTVKAYDVLIKEGSQLPQAARDELNKYKWAKDAAQQFQSAIANGTDFYFNNVEGNPGTYTNTENPGTFLGLDMGEFFNPDNFALSRLLETEGSGGTIKPKFYGLSIDYWDYYVGRGEIYIPSQGWLLLDKEEGPIDRINFDTCAVKIKNDALENVVIYSKDDSFNEMELMITFPVEAASKMWDWYN